MKSKLLLSFGLSAIIAVSIAIGAYAAGELKLVVNGQVVNAEAKLIDGTTYVPLRAVAEMLGANVGWDGETSTVTVAGKDWKSAPVSLEVTLNFPTDKYPETSAHIKAAIAKGESGICTIDRAGADENRGESLKGIPTKEGYDRDEWPMAMCAEGGAGADVEYVESSDNRGSGSWVGNQLEAYTDGTRVLFVIDGGAGNTVNPTTQAETTNTDIPVFKNCTEVKAAGKAPIHTGDPGFSAKLDRDGDGVACES